jgi:peptidoglycan/xylan/chitin deacetylase (PgdA/CDA1 family)
LAACSGQATAPAGSGARVTFVIDDGHVTDYTVKKPIFDAHGAVAVAAVPSRVRELSDGQLLELQADGWEIADHGANHLDEATLTDAQLQVELVDSRRDLESIGLRVDTHVYPYGSADDRVRRIVRQHYRAAVMPLGGRNRLPLADPYDITRTIFGNRYDSVTVPEHTLLSVHGVGGPFNLRWYKSQVDQARREGSWLVFNIHELTPRSAERLGELLDYIQAQGLPIVTIRQGREMP